MVSGVLKTKKTARRSEIEREKDRESERENMLGGHGIVKTARAQRTHHREELNWSRQLCNVSRRREPDGQRYNWVGGRTLILVHFNGIYIKAQNISSWVLDVRGSKKPFRHTASFLKVKIDRELFSFSCGQGGGMH